MRLPFRRIANHLASVWAIAMPLVLLGASQIAAAEGEPTAFVNLIDATLAEAADYLAKLAGHEIRIGPGAEGRITISSVKAMNLHQVLDAFDQELARNHLVAIKRDSAWLIVPVAIATAAAPEPADRPIVVATVPVAIVPALSPRIRFEGITYSNRLRADAMATKLRDAGLAVGIADASLPDDPAYALVIELDDTPVARAEFMRRIGALGLGALIALPPARE